MPTYGTSATEQTARLQRQPNLPNLPSTPEQVPAYLASLDRAIVDFHGTFADLLQVSLTVRGSASFGAAETTKAVAFDGLLDDVDFVPLMVPSWNAALWYSALATSGFTINASAAPGGGGGTVLWVVAR